MERIEVQRGQTVSVEITTEGKVFIMISSNSTSGKQTELVNEECEGDYKGEQLVKVKLKKNEIDKLESTLGTSCLKYWVISLEEFADTQPDKFKKYKCHRACIQNWHRRRLEEGKVFSHIHPSGPGYYYRKDIDKLPADQLKLR